MLEIINLYMENQDELAFFRFNDNIYKIFELQQKQTNLPFLKKYIQETV